MAQASVSGDSISEKAWETVKLLPKFIEVRFFLYDIFLSLIISHLWTERQFKKFYQK